MGLIASSMQVEVTPDLDAETWRSLSSLLHPDALATTLFCRFSTDITFFLKICKKSCDIGGSPLPYLAVGTWWGSHGSAETGNLNGKWA